MAMMFAWIGPAWRVFLARALEHGGSRSVVRVLGLCHCLAAVVAGLPGSLSAAHVANQLVITEVAFDTTDEATQPSSEYIEIFNPTDATISLNAGAEPGKATSLGAWFLADFFKSTSGSASTYYYQVVKGKVAVNNTQDGIFQFPQGATIPPRGTVVVTSSSEKFLAEFFGSASALAAFKALPGRPQLFETAQDGTSDGVPDMLVQSSYTSGVGNLSLSNGGELLILYYWDGRSDLIKDGDVVVWKPTSPAPELVTKKNTDALDGPDSDLVSSFFPATDLATSDSLLLAPPSSPTNAWSAQRKNIEEPLETDSAGNGLNGQDETSERWGLLPTDSSPNPSWVYERLTPGLPLILLDGKVSDAVSFVKPAAISSADGSLGSTSPLDYGPDGTLTELYVWPMDTTSDQDFLPDALYVAVRGELFGTTDSINASLVLLDLDPGKGTGVRRLDGVGADLSDTTGALDTRITRARYVLEGALGTGFGLDAALGVDSLSTSTDSAGWRSWGTGGTAGGVSDFSYGTAVDVAAGSISSLYPGAAGTRLAGPDGFEGIRSLSALSTTAPTYVLAGAVTVSDTGTGASPNALPETSQDDLAGLPQKLTLGACLELASGAVVLRYVDQDGDGVGSTQLCGPSSAGSATTGGDCNDADASSTPGKPETCDLKDNNCNGEVDEGVVNTFYADADGDGYGTSAVVTTGCVLPAGFSALSGDCNDDAPDINPGALELCDGLDNNCAGGVDEGLTPYTWYVDGDSDGYGSGAAQSGCALPADAAAVGGDCQDSDSSIHPDAVEVCDGLDNNCSGQADEALLQSFYRDQDGDGVGAGQALLACEAPAGYAAVGGDCDDMEPAAAPGRAEVCDGLDNDCDLETDEGVTVWLYIDADGDGYGGSTRGPDGCAGTPGYSANSLDCADDDPSIHPDALERCDGLDTDCDPTTDEQEDQDGDGFAACTGDCDDSSSSVFPEATEQCNAGVDDDCDPATDEDQDGDEDGASVCEGDCADDEPAMGPDGPEAACDDALDNDCDLQIDLEDVDCVEGATPTPGAVTPTTPGGVPTAWPSPTEPVTPTTAVQTPTAGAASPTPGGETPPDSPTVTAPPTGTPARTPTGTPEGVTPSGTPVTPTPSPEPTRSPRPTASPAPTSEATPTEEPTPATPVETLTPTGAPTTPGGTPSQTPEPTSGGCGCHTQREEAGAWGAWLWFLGLGVLGWKRRRQGFGQGKSR